MRHARTQNQKCAVAFFAALYLASPASPAYLWTGENFGRLETWLFIAAILLIFVFLSVRRFAVRCVLYFLIAAFALSIHQIYIFLFFPSLCVLLLEEWIRGNHEKRKVIATVCVMAALCAIFFYMQFFSGIYYDDLTALADELQRHTDFEVSVPTLQAEYFWTLRDHFVRNQLPELRERVRYGIITTVLLSPMWFLVARLQVGAIRRSRTTMEKRTRILMLLTNVAYLPVFVLMTDWGRWFAALYAVQFLNMAALFGGGDPRAGELAETAGEAIGRGPLPYLVVLLYCALFEKFEGINYVDQVQAFYYWTWNVRTFLMR